MVLTKDRGYKIPYFSLLFPFAYNSDIRHNFVPMSLAQTATLVQAGHLALQQQLAVAAKFASLLIRDHKSEGLRVLCRQCGISPAGTKADMADRLAQACKPLPRHPWRIISIDIGIRNFAKATLQIDPADPLCGRPKLTGWETISMDANQTGDPRSMATMVADVAAKLTRGEGKTIPMGEESVTEYLIERQTFRGGGTRMIPGIVQKINMIENQLHCFLLNERTLCVDPRSVAFLYSFRTGARKKRDAVNLVTSLISAAQGPREASTHQACSVEVAPSLATFFREQEKKDDLADALLQALAHYRWRLNMAKLLEKYQPDMEKEIRASKL